MRVTVEEAIALIAACGENPRIVVSGNGAVPWVIVRAVEASIPTFRLHLLNAPSGIPDREGITLETAFVGSGMRKSPRLSYFPSRLSGVPVLFRDRLPPDVVIVHTSAPHKGKVSLGCEVNVLPGAIDACRARGGLIIAQTNKYMPYTYGDGEYELEAFDAMVEVDEPLKKTTHGAPLDPNDPGYQARIDSAQTIGDLASRRIHDGMTLQLGIGEIPDATLSRLHHLRNMGIWSEMFSDGLLALDAAGALDPNRKIMASFLFGSPELYEWCHLNDRIRILRTETINAPYNISKNPGMTSINTALQVDLLDQANASRIRARIHSGFGGQTDFTVGAIHAPGGQAIMALRSWHPKANVSTIVPLLKEPVTSLQHTCVITENGVAEILGHDERDQARNLIKHAAHERAQAELWDEAGKLGLA